MKDLSVILDFDKIPINYTCDGRNISPKIVILGLDESLKVMAIIIEDIDAPSGTFTHWTIWNLSPMDIVPEGIPNEDIVDYPFEGGVPIRASSGIKRLWKSRIYGDLVHIKVIPTSMSLRSTAWIWL